MALAEIDKDVDSDLYDRAMDLLSDLLAELEDLDKMEIPFVVPDELQRAWIERDALAGTLKEISENGGPDFRAKLKELYLQKLDEADPYTESDEDSFQGPEINWELVEKAETLVEEDRRARLLA